MLIKTEYYNRFDMLTNKISKFLFYDFNDQLIRENQVVQCVRHAIIIKDKKSLVELHCLNWPYFIKKMIGIGEKLTEIEFDENKNEIVRGVIENYKICRHLCGTRYSSFPGNFLEFVSVLDHQKINEDIRINGWGLTTDIRDYSGGFDLLRSFNFFYYLSGSFPAKKVLLIRWTVKLDNFFQKTEIISPKVIFKLF